MTTRTDYQYHHVAQPWVQEITRLFVAARGNYQARRQYKAELKKAQHIFNLAWEHVCAWFKQTVREIEAREYQRLLRKYHFG